MIAATSVVVLSILGQLGSPAVGGSSFSIEPPISTIANLSLAADDDSPAMVLKVYRLIPSSEQIVRPTAAEILPVVRELFAPGSWETDGAYLRAVNNHLIVRHQATVHGEINGLLVQLQAIDPPPGKSRGGSGPCYGRIPVVGERAGAAIR